MANPSPRDAAARKVAAAARAIVTYQTGLPAGCVRMQRALFWLAPHEEDLPTIFDDYLSQTLGLPLGTERLEWERQALATLDQRLEAISQQFRDRIFTACWHLIDRFGPTKAGPTTEGSGQDAV